MRHFGVTIGCGCGCGCRRDESGLSSDGGHLVLQVLVEASDRRLEAQIDEVARQLVDLLALMQR